MLKDVEHVWKDEERSAAWRLHDLSLRASNLLLHHSGTALNWTGYAPGDGTFTFSPRPSPNNVDVALWTSFSTLALFAGLMLPDEDRDDLNLFLNSTTAAFVDLTPSELARTRRNDPCPCGSGRKFKHCHGRG